MVGIEADDPGASTGPGEDVSPVALAFLEQLVRDLERGEPAAVSWYQGRFPQQDDFIARSYASSVEARSSTDNEVIAGRYELLGELGAGGQSVVHLARDRRLGRQVALKLLRRTALGRSLAMFEREASVSSQLDDPRVCSVYDSGVDGAQAWIAMRYVPGQTLAAWIEARAAATTLPGSRDIRMILRWVAGAAKALHACHEAGVIHRDVKPSNLMITEAGDIVVLDFGVARLTAADAAALTATGEQVGTPCYMSPEQLDARPGTLDRRTDVYSLGVTLFEALALVRLFQATTLGGAWSSAQRARLPDVKRHNPGVAKDLVSVLQRTLEVDPKRRYQTAADLAADLEAAAEGRPVAARRIGPVGRLIRWSSRQPMLATLAAVVLIALPTLAVLVTLRASEAPQRRAQQAADSRRVLDRLLVQCWLDYASRRFERSAAAFGNALERTRGTEQEDEARLGAVLSELQAQRPDRARGVIEAGADSLSPFMRGQLEALVLRAEGQEKQALAIEAKLSAPATMAELWAASSSTLSRSQGLSPSAALEQSELAFDRALTAVLVNDGPHRLSTFVLLAVAASRSRDLAHRRVVTEAIATIWPEDALALYWAGAAAVGDSVRLRTLGQTELPPGQRGLIETGREKLVRAVELDPEFAGAFVELGLADMVLGDLESAEASLRRTLAIEPDAAPAHRNLGEVLEGLGRPREALESRRRAFALEPTPVNRLSLAAGLMGAGDLDDALRVLEEADPTPERAIRRDRVGGLIHYHRGLILDTQRKAEPAIAAYRLALESEPNFAPAHVNLGTLLQERGDLDAALAAYRRAIEVEPGHALAWLNAGFLLRDRQQYDEALEALRRGHEIGSAQPDWPHDSAKWVRECEELMR